MPLDQQPGRTFMAQQGNFCLNTARGREAAQRICAQDPMTGDKDGDRIGTTGLPHRLRRGAYSLGNLPIRPGFAERNGCHRTANFFMQAMTPFQRQFKRLPCAR